MAVDKQIPERSAAEQALIGRFQALTEVALPSLAKESRWPIRLDHCFKRICLDYAFGGVWYEHLHRPAERYLTGAALLRATQCAEDLLLRGPDLLRERNLESLGFRGKLKERRQPNL